MSKAEFIVYMLSLRISAQEANMIYDLIVRYNANN